MADDPPLEQVVAKTYELGASGGVAHDSTSLEYVCLHATNHDDILFVYARRLKWDGVLY